MYGSIAASSYDEVGQTGGVSSGSAVYALTSDSPSLAANSFLKMLASFSPFHKHTWPKLALTSSGVQPLNKVADGKPGVLVGLGISQELKPAASKLSTASLKHSGRFWRAARH